MHLFGKVSYNASPHHHTTATMFHCWYDLILKCCVGLKPDIGSMSSKKLYFPLNSPQKIIPKGLGLIKWHIWQMWDDSCSSWQWYLLCNSLIDAVFAQSFSNGGIMNANLMWGLQFLRWWSGFFCDFLGESSVHSWRNVRRVVTSGKIHHYSKWSPFGDDAPHYGLLES